MSYTETVVVDAFGTPIGRIGQKGSDLAYYDVGMSFKGYIEELPGGGHKILLDDPDFEIVWFNAPLPLQIWDYGTQEYLGYVEPDDSGSGIVYDGWGGVRGILARDQHHGGVDATDAAFPDRNALPQDTPGGQTILPDGTFPDDQAKAGMFPMKLLRT